MIDTFAVKKKMKFICCQKKNEIYLLSKKKLNLFQSKKKFTRRVVYK